MSKNKNNNSFISSLATTTLGSNKNESPQEEEVQQETLDKVILSTPKPSVQGNKSSLFIQELMQNHYLSHDKTKEKSPAHIDKSIHFKIKLISTVTQVSMIELTTAILSNYLEKHKTEIDTLLKKANF